ncbi:hypothetical protein MYX78_01040 [Acidobacteria bacterium AH-259-G07]|nr:hypothetical protein [Acidobacteria bacterium AH-259-G07]
MSKVTIGPWGVRRKLPDKKHIKNMQRICLKAADILEEELGIVGKEFRCAIEAADHEHYDYDETVYYLRRMYSRLLCANFVIHDTYLSPENRLEVLKFLGFSDPHNSKRLSPKQRVSLQEMHYARCLEIVGDQIDGYVHWIGVRLRLTLVPKYVRLKPWAQNEKWEAILERVEKYQPQFEFIDLMYGFLLRIGEFYEKNFRPRHPICPCCKA